MESVGMEHAWKIIDHWIKKDYDGNREAMESEVGDLDEYVIRVHSGLEQGVSEGAFDLSDIDSDPILVSSLLELNYM